MGCARRKDMVFTYYFYEVKNAAHNIVLFNCATSEMVKIENKYVSDYEHIKNGDFFVNRFLCDKQFIVFDHAKGNIIWSTLFEYLYLNNLLILERIK